MRDKAALFDLDGTLVRTHIDFPGLLAALHALGTGAGLTQPFTDPLALRAALPHALQAEADRLIEDWEEQGCAHPEPIAGAEALLRHLKQRGIGIGIVTRNCRRIAQRLLQCQNLPYDTLLAREDTARPKPYPDPVLLACAQLGVAPEETVLVGDYWPDIAAGRAAGVRLTLGIQWPHDPPGRFALYPPDLLVSSLEEAARHLESYALPRGAA